ncbi:hypothetical protein [Sphingobium sp. WCS2017Hpa-17]|nr:hypothetical protein [Sphingobium sp. WCS2017Hpa-17]
MRVVIANASNAQREGLVSVSLRALTERTYARYSPGFMRDAAAALDW